MSSVAIIGTGIAGLGCAHFLHRHCEVTLFEQNTYAGGHTHTVDLGEPAGPAATRPARTVPVDTGFMVFNPVTYPHLTRLFADLGVAIKPAPISSTSISSR